MNEGAAQADDVLLLPGWLASDAMHWQSLWHARHGYRWLEQHDWQRPLRGDWSARLQDEVLDAPRPVILVGHGLACILVAWWAAHSPLAQHKVRAALLVAPLDVEQARLREQLPGWAPTLLTPLPFASTVVASSNDEFCTQQRAQDFAKAWGGSFMDAGPLGHINSDSGLGQWEEGHALLQTLKGS